MEVSVGKYLYSQQGDMETEPLQSQLPPEEETVQEIKDIVSPILATYGDTKLYYDILRTGRKLWISVYITMNRDLISISKFKAVQKEIIEALSKEYQDFYFELLPDIEYNGVTEAN